VQAIEALVERGTRNYGRFANRPAHLNPRDEFPGVFGAVRRWRLKEWIGFTLVHPELYSSMIMQDAQYLASSEIYAYQRATRAFHQHSATSRGGRLGLPAVLPGSNPRFAVKGYSLEYEFGPLDGAHRIRFDIGATADAPGFQGELTLNGELAAPPLSISSRLPGGALYTHKSAFPAEGTVRFGPTEVTFDATRDLAILDEHKSFLPYRTHWLWGTFLLHADGGFLGANLVDRPELPGQPEESCLWTPGRVEPLADVAFEPESGAASSPWHIHSADGRLDVRFEPEGRKSTKHQFGVAAVDYFQMFGRYRGTVRGAERTYELVGIHGVCESMRARL
jgi:hypothetical protein